MSDGDGTSDAETAAPTRRPGESEPAADHDHEPESVTAEAEESGSAEAAGTGAPASEGTSDPADIDVEALIGPERRLHPRVRYVWVLQAAISSLVFAAMVGLPAFFVLDRPFVGPAVFLVVFGLGAGLSVFRYRRWSYEVREDSLFLDRGVLTQTRTVVPYVRIQHVDASRGPVERAFGLATAVVYTAGSRGADVSIPGLTPERADDLQERLKRLAIAAEGEDAV